MRQLNCPDCAGPMAHLSLAGHYGAQIQLDHCDACRQLWFDNGEFARLSREGWVGLLQHLAGRSSGAVGQPAAPAPACPVCALGLRPVHDQTVFGRFQGQQCPAGHGRTQRDATLFAARGLFRRLLPAERAAMGSEHPLCLGCGAPRAPLQADDRDGDCSYCGTPPLVIDLPRLSQSLGLTERRSTLGQGEPLRWDCQGCGQPLDATTQSACPQCQHPVVALDWQALQPLLERAATQAKAAPPVGAQAEALLAHARATERWEGDRRPLWLRLALAAARALIGRGR